MRDTEGAERTAAALRRSNKELENRNTPMKFYMWNQRNRKSGRELELRKSIQAKVKHSFDQMK